MARPERKDVDYFPFYVKDGRTLFILESKYGCTGTGFFTNMMRFLCQTPDHHFCIADDADRLFFFSKTKCDEVSGTAMLDLMAKTGKIYAPLWVSSRVIVSPDLLESIKDAYVKRKNTIITLEEIVSIYTGKPVSGTGNTEASEFPAPETPIEASNRGESSDGNPQRKVKESKVKEKKEKGEEETPPKKLFLDAVYLTDDEHSKLVERFGRDPTNRLIEDLNNGIMSKGYKYNSHYHTILTWDRKDRKSGNGNGTRSSGTSPRTPPGTAGIAKSDSVPYPVDHEL